MKVKLTAPYHAGIEVYVLKDTWMVRNAIKKACKVYMNTQAISPGQENKVARWHDFRIKPTFNNGTEFHQLLPSGFVTDSNQGGMIFNTTSTGQYDYSSIRLQTGQQSGSVSQGFVIGGTTTNQFDILQAYMDSDDTSSDEASASDAYQDFFTIRDPQPNIDDEGDLAPYNMTDLDNYLVKIDTIHSGKTTTATFDALLGWVFFRHNSEITAANPDVQISATAPSSRFNITTLDGDGNVAGVIACLQVIHSAGKYKGVRSEPIGKIMKINQKEYDVK